VYSKTGNKSIPASNWLDYYILLVINSLVLFILIIPELVRGSGVVTNLIRRLQFPLLPCYGKLKFMRISRQMISIIPAQR
jgi:hypothetical protein